MWYNTGSSHLTSSQFLESPFVMIILPNNCNLSIEQVLLEDQVTIMLRSTSLTADCPNCQTPARRLHSHYHRKPSDLPVSGHQVRLIIEVRRFFCDKATCPRKTFAQQMPSLLGPHAQRTTRLQETLQRLGLALGGEAGARLATELGMQAHPDSLLRLGRQATPPQSEPAKIIGIDDWALKRRLRYGTLICDLEAGVPVDVLPDRDVTTVTG